MWFGLLHDLLPASLPNSPIHTHWNPSCQVMEHYVPDSAPRLHLVTNIHDDVVPRRPNCVGREGLLFVGNYNHAPNREAVVFLLTQVLPALRRRLPPRLAPLAHAHVVGAGRPTEEMQALLAANAAHATFYGYLPDDELRLLYSRVKVHAPIYD